MNVSVIREVESFVSLFIDGEQADIIRYEMLGRGASGGNSNMIRIWTKFSQHDIPFHPEAAKFRTNGHTYEWRPAT